MTSADIGRRVHQILQPVLENTPIQLLNVRFLVDRGRRILRLYIDKPGGVDLNDCTTVSRGVSALLDVHQVISGRYTLEVSSPGIDWPLRKLSDYQRNVGRLLKVTTQNQDGHTHTQVGDLISCAEEEIIIKVKGQEISVSLGDIVSAKIQPRF